MDLFDLLFTIAVVVPVFAVVSYQVVRRAVRAGILDADRERERAASLRELAERHLQRDESPDEK